MDQKDHFLKFFDKFLIDEMFSDFFMLKRRFSIEKPLFLIVSFRRNKIVNKIKTTPFSWNCSYARYNT